MEHNRRWTDKQTRISAFPDDKLIKDGRRLGVSALLRRIPISDIPLQRYGETDQDKRLIRHRARQRAQRILDFIILGNEDAFTCAPVELHPEKEEEAISLLSKRFHDPKNAKLCPTLSWERAERTLRATPKALATVLQAELAGHEPTICFSDAMGFVLATRSDETPYSTRSCAYDEEAEQWRRQQYPMDQFNGNAAIQARAMGWSLQRVELAEHIAANTPACFEHDYSWFKTDPKTRCSDDGGDANALTGHREGNSFVWRPDSPSDFHFYIGWRGELRVNFVD